ncbi:uncharacterized protein LOC142022372 [Carettochelys insculpta]|uniref:uncharacterized protein LOC142022372 n=1 Tax=Carettochelys insculpta TaxID=44489 RepID=UPI003EB997FC
MCPAETAGGGSHPCLFPCSEDRDCLGSEKCCLLSCGAACLEPVREKPGECPAVKPGQVGICVEQCRHDYDCPGSQKCCGNGCGTTCTPVPPKGTPTFAPAANEGLSGKRCRSSQDCPKSETCCSHQCRQGCPAPAHGAEGPSGSDCLGVEPLWPPQPNPLRPHLHLPLGGGDVAGSSTAWAASSAPPALLWAPHSGRRPRAGSPTSRTGCALTRQLHQAWRISLLQRRARAWTPASHPPTLAWPRAAPSPCTLPRL